MTPSYTSLQRQSSSSVHRTPFLIKSRWPCRSFLLVAPVAFLLMIGMRAAQQEMTQQDQEYASDLLPLLAAHFYPGRQYEALPADVLPV